MFYLIMGSDLQEKGTLSNPHDRFVLSAVAHENVFWEGCGGQEVVPLGRMSVL